MTPRWLFACFAVALLGGARIASAAICGRCTLAAVDTASSPGGSVELEFGLPPSPIVAYRAIATGDLMFASRTSGWVREVVDSTGVVGLWPSLAVDPVGTPYISYYDSTNRDLKVAHRTVSGWTTETVDEPGDVGLYSSIAVSGSTLIVSYQDVTNGELKVATNEGRGWSFGVVDNAGSGLYSSMIVDGSYRGIAYYNSVDQELRFAHSTGGAWTHDVVESGGNVGGYASLIGNASWQAISYYDFANHELKYAWNTGSGWTVEIVDADGNPGFGGSLTSMGGHGPDSVAITYHARTPGDLRLARRFGFWSTTLLDSTGITGQFSSCRAGPSVGDSIAVAYIDATNRELHYLTYSDPFVSVPQGRAGATLNVSWARHPGGAGGRVTCDLPVAGRVTLDLFDAQGRRVAELEHGVRPAGAFTVDWDGRDEGGEVVRSGVFFLRLATPQGSATTAAVVLR
jgi:hypothetical protein